MAKRKGISTGTTAQRSIEEQGHLRFNTTTSLLEYYDGTNWKSIDSPPIVSSVDVTDVDSTAGGNETFVITGSNFSTTITEVRFVATSGSDVVASSVTRDSDTQITAVAARSSFSNAGEPYSIKVTNNSGLAGTLGGQINVDSSPAWQTASGALASIFDAGRTGVSYTLLATDADSDAITYTLESGSLPAGLSLTSASSGAVISGNADAVGSNTTSTFTIRATANSKTADRSFNITVYAPVLTTFNTSGTFTVPTGLTSVDVLVVAGGGAGGIDNAGGGGAGGLIYRPGFSITPGSPISVTVGNGGPGPGPGPAASVHNPGQDSAFGTLTAKGGGGAVNGGPPSPGTPGGSGAGATRFSATGGSATQPNQSGESGNYGFGFAGGNAQGTSPGNAGGGGGGGAGEGGEHGNSTRGGNGGNGRAYSISGSPQYYSGGGGGGIQAGYPAGNGGQGGGGAGASPSDQTPSGLNGESGQANRGGGGGAGGAGGTESGGSGGKGVVIVSY